MCMVTLSVLTKCHHELATIDYCPSAEPDQADDEEHPGSEEESTLRKACTDSLGWEIYTSLDAPVTCKSCRAWLEEQGKYTYADTTKASPEEEDNGPVPSQEPEKKNRGTVIWTSKGPALPGSPAYKLRSKRS